MPNKGSYFRKIKVHTNKGQYGDGCKSRPYFVFLRAMRQVLCLYKYLIFTEW